jgi:hypothetical protein
LEEARLRGIGFCFVVGERRDEEAPILLASGSPPADGAVERLEDEVTVVVTGGRLVEDMLLEPDPDLAIAFDVVREAVLGEDRVLAVLDALDLDSLGDWLGSTADLPLSPLAALIASV